ncbi:hypothetical protein HMI56_005063 [Coelomomyces lativittatus]|nr:hypothetical protein HMI56_005063 [Coelomomyces lativittatus]
MPAAASQTLPIPIGLALSPVAFPIPLPASPTTPTTTEEVTSSNVESLPLLSHCCHTHPPPPTPNVISPFPCYLGNATEPLSVVVHDLLVDPANESSHPWPTSTPTPTSSHFSSPSTPPTHGQSVQRGSTIPPLPIVCLPHQNSSFHHPPTYTSTLDPHPSNTQVSVTTGAMFKALQGSCGIFFMELYSICNTTGPLTILQPNPGFFYFLTSALIEVTIQQELTFGIYQHTGMVIISILHAFPPSQHECGLPDTWTIPC